MSTEHPADEPAPYRRTTSLPVPPVAADATPPPTTTSRALLDTPGASVSSLLGRLDVPTRIARTLRAGIETLDGLRQALAVVCEGLGWDSGEIALREAGIDGLPSVVIAGAAGAADGRAITCRVALELGGDVVGTMVLRRRTGAPDETTHALLRLAAAQLAQFVDHRRGLEAHERRLARQRALRSEADAANRAKDEFLANLSHELRTPLNAMLGWSRLLRGGALDGETVERGLAAIERNGEVQEQLISDLIDMARIMTGKLQLHPEPTDLAAIVEAAVDSVRHSAGVKDVTLDVQLPPARPSTHADGRRLQQVLWNLLTNAIRATPGGGRVAVGLRADGGRAIVEVVDDGVGIAPDLLPHVFERFRQGQAGDTRRHRGLGLGLSIVRHLTELHGGVVRAQSEGEGRGATFTVELPLIEPPVDHPAPAAPEPAAPPRLERLRILLVDDDTDARELLGMVLEERGARVVGAASAEAAVTAFRQEAPDVVVSDIGLPDADGYELIRALRTLDVAAARTAVAVALTGWARAEDRDAALDAGFQAHVVKPIDPAELVALLARLIAERHSPPLAGTGIALQ